jgi:isopentenyldiphosphate isomerase
MMAKKIDVYDANLQPIGTIDRRHAHNLGLWHRSFHCWVYRTAPIPAVLFQLRSPNSTNFPDLLDISAAGHLDAGETVRDGIRELHEELGIVDLTMDNLVFAGERVEVADQDNGQLNREYQSVFFAEINEPLNSYRPEPKEVWGLYWVPITEGMSLFSGELESLECEGIVWQESEGEYRATRRVFGRKDFLPRIQPYYLAALICAQRLFSGEKYIAIS